MWYRWKRMFLIVPLLLCFAGTAGAMPDKMPRGKWWRLPQAEKFSLTNDEKKALDQLYIESRRALISLKAALEKERFELGLLLDTETLDEAAAMAQFKRVEKARNDLSTERFRHLLGVRKILGHDRYQDLKMSFREMRKKWRKGLRRPSRDDRGGAREGEPGLAK